MATLPRPRALVLGCTHFPVLKNVIARVVGKDVVLVDSAATTAEAVVELLAERDLARSWKNVEPHRFLATDAPDRFARLALSHGAADGGQSATGGNEPRPPRTGGVHAIPARRIRDRRPLA